ncbi:MAG: ABC transporter permease [Chloroflexi bacterium]|nr:MAG: ABC transporter permease [Chloroflexota bacterium]
MFSYIASDFDRILQLTVQHLWLAGSALVISAVIALPIGLVIEREKRVTAAALGFLGTLYTIPSIVLIILFIPLFGLSSWSVIAALVIYTQVILVRNLIAGLRSIDLSLIEISNGLGMTPWQRWWRVQLPLALPLMIAGVRLAATAAIAIATIGAKFGAGGLGSLLFEGIAQAGRYDKILAGAVTVGILTLVVNWLLLSLERRLQVPKE